MGAFSNQRRRMVTNVSSLGKVSKMAKILCVLYADPVDGYPKSYPRDDLPKIERYPGGQTLPTPKRSTSSLAHFSAACPENWA
jgi:hypothetical protein